MGIKQSEANRRYWSKIPASVRSKRMSKLVIKRHSTMTPEQKKALGLRLTKARRRAKLEKEKQDR